jgi:hypothetical protein
VQVFSRSKAVLLEAQLAKLPAGQLCAAQQQHVQAWLSQQLQHKQPNPAPTEARHQQQQQEALVQQAQSQTGQQESLGRCDVLSPQLVAWQQQTSSLMAQLTQQVSWGLLPHTMPGA